MANSEMESSSLSPSPLPSLSEPPSDFHWTPLNISWAVLLFIAAGFAEIIGGWLVWKAVRGDGPDDDNNNNDGNSNRRPWWYALLGSMVLVLYGFIPCLQPTDSFGRIYAVYGGFFIVLSFLLGWTLDGDRPDVGDVVGGVVALIGVLIIMFWPNRQ